MSSEPAAKMWAGRFHKPLNKQFEVWQRSFRLSSLLLLSLVCAVGCKSSETTWSSNLKSPDGRHIAKARSDVFSGFGTDAAQTTVDLNWTTGSQHAVNILTLPDAPNPGNPSVLEMNWLSPTNLQLVYKGKEVPLFQAVKCYGVDIVLKQD